MFFIYLCKNLRILELLYHYLWKFKVLGSRFTLCDGRSIEVLSPGLHNNDSGPDFSHARLKIDDTVWVGNVEIHVKSSDWLRHGHADDHAYDNLILHVVADDDYRIPTPDGKEVAQLVLSPSPLICKTYEHLCTGIDNLRCRDFIHYVPGINLTDWLETLSVERLHVKSERIKQLLLTSGGDWQHALFVTFARALGFGLNGVPFELMAKTTPLNFIMRHSDNLFQIEAILFGQAGMLDASENIFDEYYQRLCREYYFLARKYSLRPIRRDLWKYTRSRPQNFPHRRIAILAGALYGGFNLADKLLNAKGDVEKLDKVFMMEASPYWKSHMMFGGECGASSNPVTLSRSSRMLLMINLAAPFYFARGASLGDSEVAELGLDLLQRLPAEQNSILRQWQTVGVVAENALRSQSLIHLRKEYCDANKCLECRIGNLMLRQSGMPMQSAEPEPPQRKRSRLVVVAQDSWKGTMSAAKACRAAAAGAEAAGYETAIVAMADGGEGTADILGDYNYAERIEATVHDPLGREISVSYRFSRSMETAFIDFATASGITLLTKVELNPLKTTSFGTGELLRHAKDNGARRIILGLGGSATVDAGLGVIAGAGGKIFDLEGNEIQRPCGADLERIGKVEPPSWVSDIDIVLAVDVKAPLTGEKGAARVFGPQKGASPEDVERLERGMDHLSMLMGEEYSDYLKGPFGAGAAGGAGAGLCRWMGASLREGAEIVISHSPLPMLLLRGSLVVTGEGKADCQTLMGKVASAVLKAGKQAGKSVILTAGKVEERIQLEEAGFAGIANINEGYDSSCGEDPLDPAVAERRLAETVYSLLADKIS